MVNPAVRVHPVDKLQRRNVEEDVDQNNERNRRKEHRNPQPSDTVLILKNTRVLPSIGPVQKEVRKDGHSGHAPGSTPSVRRVPAVLPAVGYPQEHIPRPESLPDVVAHAVEPEEGGQHADVEERIRHDEADVVAELGEDSHQIGRLANDQTHRDRGDDVADQISVGGKMKKEMVQYMLLLN